MHRIRILAGLALVVGMIAGCGRGTPPVVIRPTPTVGQPAPALTSPTPAAATKLPVAEGTTPAPEQTETEPPDPVEGPLEDLWPPSTVTPGPSPTVFLFPAVQVQQSLNAAGGEGFSLWYPAYHGLNTQPVLEQVRIDAMGRRLDGQVRQIDVGLAERSLYLDTPLYGLKAAPGGRYLALESAKAENVAAHILDASQGGLVAAFEQPAFTFFGWLPDGQGLLGRLGIDVNQPYGTAAGLNLSGETQDSFVFPKRKSYTTVVNALAASPSGKWLADSITYVPVGDRFKRPTTEISISGPDGSGRKLLCAIDPASGTVAQSMQWSPDEQSLLWIAVDVVLEKQNDETVYWLWTGNLTASRCAKTARVRIEPGALFPGGFSPQWSPDGSQILFISGLEEAEEPLAGNVTLLDVKSGETRAVTGFNGEVVSFARWMPDGQTIAFSIRRGAYGEIWAVSQDGGDSSTIAGPTTLDAPFDWTAGPAQ